MKPRIRIAILDDFQKVALQNPDMASLAQRVEFVTFADHVEDPVQLAARLRDFDGICLMRERTTLDAALLRALPRLRLILCTGRRNESTIDIAAASAQGITACWTDGMGTPAAELTWGLILSLAHRIHSEIASFRAGCWQLAVGTALEGKTLGILGLGTYGGRLARFGQAFGMQVTAWSPNLTHERAVLAGANLVSKEALFQSSDVISLHMPLSARSTGIVGTDDIARMKPSAYLVNTSRAGLIDHAALMAALHAKRIAGYGTDVFEQEPLPRDHPFRSMPNVLATPHIGYVTVESYKKFYSQTAENIAAWLDQAPIRLLTPEP